MVILKILLELRVVGRVHINTSTSDSFQKMLLFERYHRNSLSGFGCTRLECVKAVINEMKLTILQCFLLILLRY